MANILSRLLHTHIYDSLITFFGASALKTQELQRRHIKSGGRVLQAFSRLMAGRTKNFKLEAVLVSCYLHTPLGW